MHPGLQSGTTDVNGDIDIDISHEKVGIVWRIYQLTVGYDKLGNTTVQLLVNGLPYSSEIIIRSGKAASGDPPCDIGRGEILTVRMVGGPATTNVRVAYYYDEINEDVGQ